MNTVCKFLLTSFFSFYYFTGICQTNTYNIGVVLCGAEFGEKQLPGKLNTDYTYPTVDEINYFASKGFNPITLPFKWERVQRNIGSELDSAEIQRMKKFLSDCDSANIKVILTLQNFAVYTSNSKDYLLGSRHLSFDTYKDFWKKMASAFSDCHNIYGFDIMNEPRGIFGRHWRKAAQHAIDGIREVNVDTYIIVDGENSSFAANWKYENNKLRKLEDKSNKIIYDAHCYFDYDHSGRYNHDDEYHFNSDVGIDRVKPFVQWLKRYKKNGIIGEFGVPAERKWLEVMDKFLAYAKQNGLNVTYWAAGPWWNNYPLSIEPTNDAEKPQMNILEKYLPQVSDTFINKAH